jgi:hypothetical protein
MVCCGASWDMRRKSKPLGIKMTGDGFQSDGAAQFAGKQALADFLSDLAKEEDATLFPQRGDRPPVR